jgi:hypothetical protein
MNYGIPNTQMNRALASTIGVDTRMVSAKAAWDGLDRRHASASRRGDRGLQRRRNDRDELAGYSSRNTASTSAAGMLLLP